MKLTIPEAVEQASASYLTGHPVQSNSKYQMRRWNEYQLLTCGTYATIFYRRYDFVARNVPRASNRLRARPTERGPLATVTMTMTTLEEGWCVWTDEQTDQRNNANKPIVDRAPWITVTRSSLGKMNLLLGRRFHCLSSSFYTFSMEIIRSWRIQLVDNRVDYVAPVRPSMKRSNRFGLVGKNIWKKNERRYVRSSRSFRRTCVSSRELRLLCSSMTSSAGTKGLRARDSRSNVNTRRRDESSSRTHGKQRSRSTATLRATLCDHLYARDQRDTYTDENLQWKMNT